MDPLSWTCLPPPTPLCCHTAPDLNSLCHTANSHWLSVLHIVMYMLQCYSPNLSHLLLPTLCPQVCLLCLYFHCCTAYRFINSTDLLQEAGVDFLTVSILFLFSISLLFLCLHYFLFLFYLLFFSFLMWKFRLLIWDLSHFPI